MRVGMLLFDNSDKPILLRIEKVLQFYLNKEGHSANLVYIHPSMLDDSIQIDGVQIFVTNSLLPNHFWVGVKDD